MILPASTLPGAILPGATLGMLGGGQLGRMFTVAARTMGYRVVVLDPDPESPAGAIADEHLCADYTEARALSRMGAICAAVTTEFENVPARALERLADLCPVHPHAVAVYRTQDRIREKTFIRDMGLPTAAFAVVEDEAGISDAFAAVDVPAILKRAAFGYDGKGQARVATADEAVAAFRDMGGVPCVLERRVNLAREISVVLSRGADGETVCFPVAENIHIGGILHMSIVPARVDEAAAEKARGMAAQLAGALDYRGVMAVEFFIDDAGELLVNEIAPRPHNSGHYTLDACVASQFEQQVRAVCGLPPGDTRQLSPAVMVNLLGDLWAKGEPDWAALLAHPRVKLHLYGKREARPGRKMGHFCVLSENLDEAIAEAVALFAALKGEA